MYNTSTVLSTALTFCVWVKSVHIYVEEPIYWVRQLKAWRQKRQKWVKYLIKFKSNIKRNINLYTCPQTQR